MASMKRILIVLTVFAATTVLAQNVPPQGKGAPDPAAVKPLAERKDVVSWKLLSQVELVKQKDRYVPQFAGLCAAGLADGRTVESDPTAFLVRDGKLYLFSAAKGVDRVENDPSLLVKARQAYSGK